MPLTVTRKSKPELGLDGTLIAGATSTFTIRASVQPADRIQLENDPFLRDYKQLYTLYSSTELQIAQAGTSEADVVSIFGRDFEVVTCEHWQNKIRSHYKILVGR